MEKIRIVAVCAFSIAAVVWDIRSRRIPNGLILLGLCLGMVFRIFYWGILGGILFLGGMCFPIAVLFILFYFRMMGAGDLKLLAVIGGFLGVGDVGKCLLVSLVFGGIFSLVLLLYRRNLKERLRYFLHYGAAYLETGEWRPYRNKGQEGGEFSFSIPVLLSVFCYVGGFY